MQVETRARCFGLIVIAALACACGDRAAAPRRAPLEPTTTARSNDSQPAKVDLARPEDTGSGQPVAAARTDAKPPAAVVPAASSDEVFNQLGPISVISFDDAKSAADSQIDKTNADAELQKLKAQLSGGG